MTTEEVNDNFTEREVERIEKIISEYLSSEEGINKIETRVDGYLSKQAGINKVEARIKKYFSTYLRILKAFLLGLGIVFVAIILSGLITKQNLFVLLHDSMFGTEKPGEPLIEKIKESITKEAAISYHRSFILKDPNQPNERMLFFAEKGQEVKIYLVVDHYGAKEERRLLNVWLNGKTLYEETEDIKGGFKNITKEVFHEDRKVTSGQESIHELEFNLSDAQSPNLDDKVFIDCVIIVLGKELDENK